MREGWLGFPDLWSGQKSWWDWYLTPMVNFGKIRRAQYPHPLSSPPQWAPGIFSDLLRSVQMLKRERESGVRKATGSYRTYSSLVKLQPWFLSLRWKTVFGQNCSLGAWVCSARPVLGQNILLLLLFIEIMNKNFLITFKTFIINLQKLQIPTMNSLWEKVHFLSTILILVR